MTAPFRAAVVLTALAAFAPSASALEVWLASTDRCNSCALYQRAAQARGYGRALQYSDGSGLTIPILSVDKNVLPADVLAQLSLEDGPDNPYWEQTLTVLVMDVGRVLVAGNIAESADNNELRLSDTVMFPPAEPDKDHPAVRGENPYTAFFTANWNLEYFVDVALGKRPRRQPAPLVDLAAPVPGPPPARTVILLGWAGMPIANSLFIPTRIAEIRAAIERTGIGGLRYVTLYGHGPHVEGNDTSYIERGRTRFKRADVQADYAADAAGRARAGRDERRR